VAHHIAAVPVEPFLWTWQFDAVDPRRAELQSSWVGKLLEGKITLRDLLDATQARYRDELHQPEPPSFLIYIDQGEELYARAAERGLRLRHTRRVYDDRAEYPDPAAAPARAGTLRSEK
jgi:hypothetical protein